MKSILNIVTVLAILLISTFVFDLSNVEANSTFSANKKEFMLTWVGEGENTSAKENLITENVSDLVTKDPLTMDQEGNKMASSYTQTDNNQVNGFLIFIIFAVFTLIIIPGVVVFFVSRKSKS